jgi:NAD+ synthase
MDIDNSSLDLQCVKALRQQKHFEIIDVPLLKQFQNHVQLLKLTKPAALANLKARLRAITLYALAQEHNLLVAGTGNADEAYMGYFTKFGDGAADILPIVHLTKKRVFESAKLLNVPSIITQRAPSASLYKDQTDESEMGVAYESIDAYLNFKKIKTHDQLIIERFHKNNQHKFSMPVQPKAFEKIRK